MTKLKTEASTVADGGPVQGDRPHRWWFTPAFFMLVPVALSFLAWAVLVAWRALGHTSGSWEELTGFSEWATISVRSIVLLLVWYSAVVLIATIGWRLGADKEARAEVVAPTGSFERLYFLLILAFAVVGVVYSYYRIGNAQSILESLTAQTGNDFTNSLSGSTGIETLRYATILAAPISIYLWRKKVIGWAYMVGAVTLLLLNAMIASRLALLMAGFVYVVIWVKTNDPLTRKGSRPARVGIVIAVVLVVFAALTALNYVRNANYYRDAGVTNPISMNLYQMGGDRAVPAQVSLGVSDAVMGGTWEQRGSSFRSMDAVQPTFLQFDKVRKDDSWKGPAIYGYTVSFAVKSPPIRYSRTPMLTTGRGDGWIRSHSTHSRATFSHV